VPQLTSRLLAFALVVIAALPASVAHAQPSGGATNQCIAAHVEAQRLQKSAKLREARAALVRCSDPACPSVLVQECTNLFSKLDSAVPSLVFVARDPDGRDVADAKVFDGGALLLERLDGKAVEVDPGEHVFRVERPGLPPVERKLVVREGDKLRRVEVQLGGTDQAPPSGEMERDVTPAFWVVGSAGLVGLALFGGLAGAGIAKKGDLDDAGCAPRCPTADVDEVRSLFLGADISLGLGITALAVAPILYFTSPMVPVGKSATWIVPSLSPDNAGLLVGGAW
jgi:hypothetical protein